MYFPATIVVLSGTVESVNKVTPMKGMHSEIHLMIKMDREVVNVHLGPERYVDKLDATIQIDDRVEVKGSRFTIVAKPAIIAAEIHTRVTIFLS